MRENHLNGAEHLGRKSGAGFTLIELIVTIAIIAVLSGFILFSVTQYISKGKDSNIYGNLVVLIPAGEVYYNGNGNSYQGFCSSTVVSNATTQMPPGTTYNCYVEPTFYQSWAACAREFTNCPGTLCKAYCVDSRGMKEEMSSSSCTSTITQCP